MASDPVVIQHPPAVKVAGRRLSLSSRHARPHNASSLARSKSQGSKSPTPDYPRPAPPGEEQTQLEQLHTAGEEEVPPKKEKRHNMHDNENKIKESVYRKVEMTRPTRDSLGKGALGGGFGGAGRIAQPAGKGLAA